MIILDTNVISELMRHQQDRSRAVVRWLDGVAEPVTTTTITIFDLRLGIALLAEDHRRRELSAALTDVLGYFTESILTLDLPSAEHAAAVIADRRTIGRSIDVQDALIAGIARSCGATLATRNTGDFASTGVALVDPWKG